ncbi:MAG: cbb3-type cytochrome oxidase assembly protein CcoS [Terricaulis sp.]
MVFLIPAALFLALLGLGGFFWSLSAGQYDDLDGAAHRILIDDDEEEGKASSALQNETPPIPG